MPLLHDTSRLWSGRSRESTTNSLSGQISSLSPHRYISPWRFRGIFPVSHRAVGTDGHYTEVPRYWWLPVSGPARALGSKSQTYEYSKVPVSMIRIPSMNAIRLLLSWGSFRVMTSSLAAVQSSRSLEACISSVRYEMISSRGWPDLYRTGTRLMTQSVAYTVSETRTEAGNGTIGDVLFPSSERGCR